MQANRMIRLGALIALGAAAILSAGCSGTNDVTAGKGEGQVKVVLSGAASTATATTRTDAGSMMLENDGPQLQAVQVTLSSILARNLDGQLVDVTIDLPATIDLLAVAQGQTYELPMGALPAGSYDQIVVVIRTLSVTLADGTKIDVTPPGGGWTAIVPTDPFDVVEGQVTTVNLHFRPAGALRWVEDHFEFHPSFDCNVDDGGHHDGGDDDQEGEND
jgi:uncharacterized protein DUF4382